jgi:preprotein translocase subunit SecA
MAQVFANQAQLDDFANNQKQYETYVKEVNLFIPATSEKIQEYINSKDMQGLTTYFEDLFHQEFKTREKKFGKQIWFDVVRFMFLSTIDTFFTQHLTSIDDLREGIGLRRHAQLDPLVQYKNEAYSMFENLLRGIYFEGARRIFNVEITQQEAPVFQKKPQEGLVFEAASQSSAYKEPKQAKGNAKVQPPKATASAKKIGRNDPCPCGAINPITGKPFKYKQCGLVNAPQHRG